MARRQRKPYDPAAATKAALDRQEREGEIARLQAQGAVVTLDLGRRIISARRSNVFRLLLERNSITPNQYEAAYRLSLDWAAWKGMDGGPEGASAGFVDSAGACREIVTDRMINGGKRVKATLDELPDLEGGLLRAFMVATVEHDRPMAWRGIVERVTGYTARDPQTRIVVRSLELLRQEYEGATQDRVPTLARTA